MEAAEHIKRCHCQPTSRIPDIKDRLEALALADQADRRCGLLEAKIRTD